ncbi:hypothetical protein EV421DRAFT_1689748, partial [Armillaria borealis]
VCKIAMFDTEFCLREGQCSDALSSLQTRLMACQHLIRYHNANVVGQRMSMRARTLIDTVSDRVNGASEKYRHARQAMVVLRGEDACTGFKRLEKDDIVAVQVQERDAKATKKLGRVGGCHSRSAPVVKDKPLKLSWIWTAMGGPEELDGGVHESVRVEWAKALARKTRWTEEVQILREEMRHTLLSLQFEAGEW